MKVLVVGANSFIARHFIDEARGRFQIVVQSHREFLSGTDALGCNVVVNFAIDPAFFTSPYDPQFDMDLLVARRAAAKNAHFVMMSSRKVYGRDAPMPVAEDHNLAPGEEYGRNKARAEAEVRRATGEKSTIVRGANIFGFEPDRRTFFGRALTSLRDDGHITLDESPFSRRDFVTVESFSQTLAEIVSRCAPGTFNVGSGRASSVGQLALCLIEGYGVGDLHIVTPEVRDEFLLDNTKLERELGTPLREQDLNAYCRSLGKRLINA